MSLTKVKIEELQPSDVPRKKTLKYYSSLSFEELFNLSTKPQVWVTDLGLIVSDGNNYIFESARRGLREIEVEINKEMKEYGFPTNETIIDATALREIGVKSCYDFFNIFPNDPRNNLPCFSYAV